MKKRSIDYWRRWRDKDPVRARRLNTERMRRYRALNPEKYRAESRQRIWHTRKRLFEMYGAVCQRCGFDDKRALTLDHRNGNGNDERRRVGERGTYRKALAEYRPDLYRTLCMNCQFITRRKG